jgi:hypothetical protein
MNKKYIFILAVISAVVIICQSGMAHGNSLKVHETMIKLKVATKVIKEHAQSKDYFRTAEKFMDIARLLKGLGDVEPKKHTKKEWDSIHETIIDTAFRGIGACGRKDDQSIKQSIEDIFTSMSAGHKLFR